MTGILGCGAREFGETLAALEAGARGWGSPAVGGSEASPEVPEGGNTGRHGAVPQLSTALWLQGPAGLPRDSDPGLCPLGTNFLSYSLSQSPPTLGPALGLSSLWPWVTACTEQCGGHTPLPFSGGKLLHRRPLCSLLAVVSACLVGRGGERRCQGRAGLGEALGLLFGVHSHSVTAGPPSLW